MTIIVKWGSYGYWSGPFIRGTNRYTDPRKPSNLDVIVAAIAGPEGGSYDGVFMADGTGVTWGLFQWTLTSGRLQRLLGHILEHDRAAFHRLMFPMLCLLGVELDKGIGGWVLRDRKTGTVLDKKAIRRIFTPPNGEVPKTGNHWSVAKAIAECFAALGSSRGIPLLQEGFGLDELAHESTLRRPKLGGRTIAGALKIGTAFFTAHFLPDETTPLHALFFSLWQNGPREAERILRIAITKPNPTLALARLAAGSIYGNWGLVKAKANGRTARYTKIAKAVNRLMGRTCLPAKP